MYILATLCWHNKMVNGQLQLLFQCVTLYDRNYMYIFEILYYYDIMLFKIFSHVYIF